MFAQRFFRPIQDLSEKFNISNQPWPPPNASQILDEPVLVKSDPHAIPLDHPRGEIEFRNVWFSYRGDSGVVVKNAQMNNDPELADEDWVLRDVSFRVEPGQPSPSSTHRAGKTTLISLLLRFYDVQRGQILLDGKDIRLIDLQDLRVNSESFCRIHFFSPAPSKRISVSATPASTAQCRTRR